MKYYKAICYCDDCLKTGNKDDFYILDVYEKDKEIRCSLCKKEIGFKQKEELDIKETFTKPNPFKMVFSSARQKKGIQWNK